MIYWRGNENLDHAFAFSLNCFLKLAACRLWFPRRKLTKQLPWKETILGWLCRLPAWGFGYLNTKKKDDFMTRPFSQAIMIATKMLKYIVITASCWLLIKITDSIGHDQWEAFFLWSHKSFTYAVSFVNLSPQKSFNVRNAIYKELFFLDHFCCFDFLSPSLAVECSCFEIWLGTGRNVFRFFHGINQLKNNPLRWDYKIVFFSQREFIFSKAGFPWTNLICFWPKLVCK